LIMLISDVFLLGMSPRGVILAGCARLKEV
jgi:hypothetical protein